MTAPERRAAIHGARLSYLHTHLSREPRRRHYHLGTASGPGRGAEGVQSFRRQENIDLNVSVDPYAELLPIVAGTRSTGARSIPYGGPLNTTVYAISL